MLHLRPCPLRARRTCPGQVNRDVAGDSEHPGPQRASLRVVAVGGAPRPQEGLLYRLLCQTIIAQCSVGHPVEFTAERVVGCPQSRFAVERRCVLQPSYAAPPSRVDPLVGTSLLVAASFYAALPSSTA